MTIEQLQNQPVEVLVGAGAALAVLVLAVLALLVRRSRRRRAARLEAESSEVSPVVEALLRPPVRGERRRMRIPPRAERAGRVPGPGVMQVAEVALPAGAPRRPVDAPTVELGAAGDGGTVPATPTMWVSSDVYAEPAAAYKQLAAGFERSGVWPVLLPASPDAGDGEPWYEQRARRDRDTFDATAAERLATHLAESLAGSPLATTQLLAASGVARGELTRGSGTSARAIDETLHGLGPARLALVSTTSPAAIVHRTAWPAAARAQLSGIELATLLTSWEERWGALLVAMSEAALTLAVLRPPATFEEAVEAAAELHALCPDEAAAWGDDRGAARMLLNAPTWRLSWQ